MTLTTNFFRNEKNWIAEVDGKEPPEHLKKLRVPPAWVNVKLETDPSEKIYATGIDLAGRNQKIYSPEHKSLASCAKFEKIQFLIQDWPDIETQVEMEINKHRGPNGDKVRLHGFLVVYLIMKTGMRPGTNAEMRAKVKAYGATTLRCKHVHKSGKNVRLKFIGKKGVAQNVLVTNPCLVDFLLEQKQIHRHFQELPVFNVSYSYVQKLFQEIGDGSYTAKDLRTATGTKLALDLISKVKWAKTKKDKKKQLNEVLDRVAAQLGNTRTVAKHSYVDPSIIDLVS